MRGMRPTNWLCLACAFRVAINEQSDMTTGCKFQYLQKNCLFSLLIACPLMCNSSVVSGQVWETWLTCVTWHVGWNTWMLPSKTVCKCSTHCFLVLFPLSIAHKLKSLICRTWARESHNSDSARTETNVLPCCFVSCGWFFRRTSFNFILTLIHPPVLQMREYPLKTVSYTLCHFYLRTISSCFFSSQLSSFSAVYFSASIHSLPDVRLCGVLSNRPRTSMVCLRANMTRSD